MSPPTHSSQWYRERDALLWHPYTQMAEYPEPAGHLIIERGEGVFVYDTEGRRFLDGYAQMWCNVWGHNRAELNAAITAQLGRIAKDLILAGEETAIDEVVAAGKRRERRGERK